MTTATPENNLEKFEVLTSHIKKIINTYFIDQRKNDYNDKNEIRTKFVDECSKLEYKLINNRNRYCDVIISTDSIRIGIKLRYLKNSENNGRVYGYRHDFVKDIYKLKQTKETHQINFGMAILISKIDRVWEAIADKAKSKAFDLTDGKVITGELVYIGNSAKNLDFGKSKYKINWSPKLNNSDFRYCIVKIL